MNRIALDFSKQCGAVKPMHSVNNGPIKGSEHTLSNFEAYKAAGIPYSRNHDAFYSSNYGGPHIVDINAIFPDFDADPYEAESYDFVLTDILCKTVESAGTQVYFRLGSSIEHTVKKYGTLPPKDFHKWAIICEHIIKHYNYGWANGFEMGIQYWEIWNEPDLDADDSLDKRTWGGTKKQFFELYDVAAKHLKTKFPELKIGGPAIAFIGNDWWIEFLDQLSAPLDFFSWHIYGNDVDYITKQIYRVREILDKKGYTKSESILNEWNYATGKKSREYMYKAIQGLKGSAFTATMMCEGQNGPLDMLMYYDASPDTGFNGMFSAIYHKCLKGYYPFKMFNELYKIGTSVYVDSDCKDVHACAAYDGNNASIMITYFNEDDDAPDKEVRIDFKNAEMKSAVCAKFYLLDENNDCELVKEEIFSGEQFSAFIKLGLFNTYLIQIETI